MKRLLILLTLAALLLTGCGTTTRTENGATIESQRSWSDYVPGL